MGDTLVFLGIDISTAKFVNPDKLDKSIYIRNRHGEVWGRVDDILIKRQDMKYDFQKKVIITTPTLFDNSYRLLDSNWVVEKYEGLTDIEVRKQVSTYPLIQNSKLGLAILVDKMDMPQKQVSVCAAYIDLTTNIVIKILRAEGGIGGGFGYTAYWKTGFENAYHGVISQNDKYLKELRRFLGIKK